MTGVANCPIDKCKGWLDRLADGTGIPIPIIIHKSRSTIVDDYDPAEVYDPPEYEEHGDLACQACRQWFLEVRKIVS